MKSLRVMLGHEEPPKAKLKSKFEFTAAGVTRILEHGERKAAKPVWSAKNLYASGLGYVTIPEFILQYFEPQAKVFPYNVALAMELGTASHNYFQDRLMRAGVLYPQQEDGDKYQEVRVECKEHRIVSKIDGLVSEEQLKEMGTTKWDFSKKWDERPLRMDLLEIKVINSFSYKNTQGPEDISEPYRMQATATQMISGYKRTVFMFVDRDSLNFRFIEYVAEPQLWDRITKMSADIFKHLRELTMPEGFDKSWIPQGMTWDQWVNMKIEQSPKRKWIHLEREEEEEVEQLTLPFFLN